MAYQEPKKRSIRLDDDVYAAVRKLPMSLNQFLRKVLSADGAFRSQVIPPENLVFLKEPITTRSGALGGHLRKPFASQFDKSSNRKPLLKPKDRSK